MTWLILPVMLAVAAWTSQEFPNRNDRYLFEHMGQTLLAGGTMYLDCWDPKPPGLGWWNAAVLWVGGGSTYAITAAAALAGGLAVLMTAWGVSRTLGRSAALPTAIVFAVVLSQRYFDALTNGTELYMMSAESIACALAVLAIIPLLGWVSAKFQRRILKSARVVRSTNSRITGSYNEAIMGILTSKAFVREKANLEEFSSLTDTMYSASVQNLTQAAVYLPLVITLASLATGFALAIGGVDLLGGMITAGTLIAFMAYTRHFFDPVEQFGHWFAEMQMAQASAERILSLIETDPKIKDSPSVLKALAQVRAAPGQTNVAADGGRAQIEQIELRDVGFFYDAAQPVLSDINLTVVRGETIAIVGPTGGGKSTLVNVICRFYEPTSGTVLIDGTDYRNRSLHWLQSNLGMVLQNAHIFGGSIMENIRYGRLSATDEEVMEATKLAGAHEFISAFSEGYATATGEGGNRLSAGQKQLVSFARAILADPQILVMDEATSSVDTETEQHIQQGLANVLEGRIAFVIAHRLSTIRNATRIIVIEHGRISETGSHIELMALRGHYYDLYRQQSLQESGRYSSDTPHAAS